MEITEQQFTANLEQMPEQQQVQVVQLIEQNDSEILQSFAASLGVNLSTGEEEAPLDSSEEVGGEPPLLPRERNLQIPILTFLILQPFRAELPLRGQWK